jgi:hypothetical protein
MRLTSMIRQRRVLFAALALATLPLAARAQTDSAAPPRSAAELAERYRRAHARRDAAAVERLFYWGASTPQMHTLVSSFIAQDVSNAVRGVSVIALDSSDRTSYVQNGVSYRTTLQPTAKLRIDFLPRTVNGGQYKSEQTTYFIGVKNGVYWLLTAEPASPR